MKLLTALLASTALLAACNQAPSETPATSATAPAPSADTMGMPSTQQNAMASDATAAASGPPASATGTVESVDVVNGKITIAHGPVPALQWPAMTMAFAATPEQLQSVRAGQQVDFEFVSQGVNASLTSIHGR